MKKTTIKLMVIAIFSKLIGLLRDIILTSFYGTSSISDIYIVSTTIPTVVFSFITMGISSGYVPVFSKLESNEGYKASLKFTNDLINAVLLMSSLFVIIGLFFTEPIIKIFASGFEGNTLNTAVIFTRISFLSLVFNGFISVANDFLRIKKKHVIVSVIEIIPNIFLILLIILSYYKNVYILGFSTILVSIIHFLIILPFIYKKGFNFKFTLNFQSQEIKQIISLTMPLIAGVAINQINVVIDKTIASTIAVGGISALTYSNRLTQIIHGIFVIPIISMIYPTISSKFASNEIVGFKKIINQSVKLITLLVVPSTFGMMAFSYQIVNMVFGRGNFGEEAISLTSNTLFFYSLGMYAVALREVLARSFYSMNDTKTPMVNASIAVVLNIFLNILFSYFLGIPGLALATSISAIFSIFLLGLSLRKKIGGLGMKYLIIPVLKILLASSIMSIISKLFYSILKTYFSVNLSLLISIFIGVIVYFILVFLMKIEESSFLLKTIKNKKVN